MRNSIALSVALTLALTLGGSLSAAFAQGTAFTYQGQLSASGAPAKGSYDMTFTLYATNVTGAPIAGPVTNAAIAVSNGLFQTSIDFGNAYSSQSNWLEIAVSTNQANTFTLLAPRQQLTPVPYAITSANLSGVVSAAQLPGNVITNGASGVSFSGTFTGNGSGITNVPGALAQVVASGTNIAAQPNTVYDLTNSSLATVSLPISSDVGDIVQVDGTGTGGWQVTGTDNANYNSIWTEQTSAPTSSYWQSIASSSDGTHLAAVVYSGGIWTSTNSGATWIEQTNAPTSAIWYSIASSSDGTHLAAVVNGSGIWTSTNSGATWIEQTNAPTSASWQSIASSSDGAYLAAVVNGGGIWTSTNSGATWIEQTSAPTFASWQSIASSSDGTHLAAIVAYAGVWTSTNGGVNWTEQANAPTPSQWQSIASSSDGTHLAAVVSYGAIWTSTNSGVTWAERTSAPTSSQWQSIASSSDGTHLAAVVNGGGIWTSTNSGVTWAERTSAPTSASWQSIASSSDGANLAAVAYSGGIWTAIPVLSGSPGTSEQFQYLGNGVWQPLPPIGGYASVNGLVSALPGNVLTNTETGVTLSGTFSGNGSGLTSISSTALPSNVITNTETGVTLSGAFSGNGSGLTSMPANVALLNGNQTFTGTNVFQLNSDGQQGLRITDGSTNSNVSIQPLTGVNSGFQAINFNGYFNGNEQQYNSNKARWRIFVDQRSSSDAMNIDSYLPGRGNAIALTILTNSNVGIGTTTPVYPLQMASGAYVSAAGVWTSVSDRNVKEDFTTIQPQDVLGRLVTMPITQWRYKVEPDGTKHIGPMAQDFYAAFGLGNNNKAIGSIDEDGVALAAIQGLNQKVDGLKAELNGANAENAQLKEQLKKLEAAVELLEKKSDDTK